MLVLSLVVFLLSDYTRATKELENAYIMQHKSFLLADELRQSSDDLTRVARTYVITGNTLYKEQFHTILAIRNGELARPKNYNGIYWDFYTLKKSKESLDGEKIPLRELMKKAGFLDDELALLYKSQKESDALTNLETKAMNAIIGLFDDVTGAYTKKGFPNFSMAREIMYSTEYHNAKISIMKSIDEFYKAFEKRTRQKIEIAHKKVKKLETYAGYSIIALIILVLFTFYTFISRIVFPLEMIKNIMLRLSNNDMEVSIPKNYTIDEVGDLIGTAEVFKSNAIKLINSEQKNKLLLNLAGEGIFGLDKYARFDFLNPMACALLGASSQDELIGKFFHKTISTNDIATYTKQNKKLLLIKENELSFKSLTGQIFPIDYVSTPIYDNNGLLNGSVVVFSDSTERIKSQDKMKSAITKAQSASRSKSIFLANMSHELRTPLNAILGFTSLLKKSLSLNEQEKENLNIIHRSGNHLLSIITEILELSKIEAGKIDIKYSDFDLYKSIKEINQMFVSRCQYKNIQFEVEIQNNVPQYINCDEVRLRQIIINLLENAIKFTHQGHVKLSISVKNSQLYFRLADTGIGISKENLDSIFKAFEQIKLNKVSSGGTGLGLAITKELVLKMGGNIEVKSEIDKGSIFSFIVEFKPCKQEEKLVVFEKEIVNIKDAHKKRLLIVDDIKQNRQLLVQLLAQYNFNIFEACDGLEALRIIEEESIDLIFMDILMPNLDGLQTTQKIRENNNNVPIVIVSAYVFEEDKQKALSLGATAYLNKPFDFKDVFKVLKEHLAIEVIYKKENLLHRKKEEDNSLSKELLQSIQKVSQMLDSQLIVQIMEENSVTFYHAKIINSYLKNYDFKGLYLYCESELEYMSV